MDTETGTANRVLVAVDGSPAAMIVVGSRDHAGLSDLTAEQRIVVTL